MHNQDLTHIFLGNKRNICFISVPGQAENVELLHVFPHEKESKHQKQYCEGF